MHKRMVIPRFAAMATASLLLLIPHAACEDGQTCASLDTGTSCGSGRVCNMSLSCTTTCEDDSSCDAGMACWNGICEPSCEVETTCGPGMACSNGICAPKCDASTPCGHGLTCGLNLVCTARCDEDTQCATGMQCDNGGCQLKSQNVCANLEEGTRCNETPSAFCADNRCQEGCFIGGGLFALGAVKGCDECATEAPTQWSPRAAGSSCTIGDSSGSCDGSGNCVVGDSQCPPGSDFSDCFINPSMSDTFGVCLEGICRDKCWQMYPGDDCTTPDGYPGTCDDSYACVVGDSLCPPGSDFEYCALIPGFDYLNGVCLEGECQDECVILSPGDECFSLDWSPGNCDYEGRCV